MKIQKTAQYKKDFKKKIQGKHRKKKHFKNGINLKRIQEILNSYGIYFVCEKALSGMKVRGAFKVKGKQPAVYVTENYAGKDSFYCELFHELGHCKSDYNIAKNKVIIEANEEREKRADQFALENMIPIEIEKDLKESTITEQNLLLLSTKEHIPMSFFVGRLAKEERLAYSNRLYQKYYFKLS